MMERLTHQRVNGIKTGYWSAASKEEVVQRLAAYENTGLEPKEISELATNLQLTCNQIATDLRKGKTENAD